MAEEVPTGDMAVFAFLEMIALAFAFEGTSALLNGLGWQICAKSYLAASAFFVAGIKWSHLKRLLGVKGTLFIGLAASIILNFWIGNPLGRSAKSILTWWNGTHGRGFDRFIGALDLLAGLVVLLFTWGLILILRQNRQNARIQAPKGFLEYKLDAEVSMNKMPAIINDLTKIMGEVGPSFKQHTQAMGRAAGTSQHLKISEAASSSLDKYSARMKRVGAKYVQAGETLCTGLTGWSKWMEDTRPTGIDPTFRAAMEEFNERLGTSTEQMWGYMVSIHSMRGVSRSLDAATERHVLALKPILEMNLKIKSTCESNLKTLEGLS